MPARLAAAAPVLLAISIAVRFALTYLVPHGANFVDLHVYVGGAEMLDHPGQLYVGPVRVDLERFEQFYVNFIKLYGHSAKQSIVKPANRQISGSPSANCTYDPYAP